MLTYLAEHQGRVISYDELLDAVWQDAIVTPNTLQRIAQLKKCLKKTMAQRLSKLTLSKVIVLNARLIGHHPRNTARLIETNGEQNSEGSNS